MDNGYRAAARINATLSFTFIIFVLKAELRLAGRCASFWQTTNKW